VDADADTQAVSEFASAGRSAFSRGSLLEAENGLDPMEAVVAAASGVAASDAREAWADVTGTHRRSGTQ